MLHLPNMKYKRLIFVIGLLQATLAFGQCAPGIPSAGNPGCIPPNQSNSPYNQGQPGQGPAVPHSHWEDRWGAVAMDFEETKAGYITGQTSESEARQIALSKCESSGGRNCKIVISYFNQCAALGQGNESLSVSSATAADADEANKRVLTKCGGKNACTIIYNECSPPELIQ